MKIEKEAFGTTPTGVEVFLFRIHCQSGASFELTNYGATWVSAIVPDRVGSLEDVLLGYPNLEGYLADTAYVGRTIGRYANRIGNAGFYCQGQWYSLDKNDGMNTNHGGFSGLHQRVFQWDISSEGVTFSLFSPDGEGGYPGNLHVEISYQFSEDQEVSIHYKAVSDKDTFVNLTNHAYFNLEGKGKILDHWLRIPSTKALMTNDQFIPTGEITDVRNTVFDFSKLKRIGSNIFDADPWLLNNKGYNHCFVLNDQMEGLRTAAELVEPKSGRVLTVKTTKPSVIIYSAGFLQSTLPGKSGERYAPYDGICIETQFDPDAPNKPDALQYLLKKGDIYEHRTTFEFKTQ
ncbi:MAG TPA: aldose epimerase family protein [Bacteroidales bacterium]|nr:aldose epimerase family protein [Bacteroidales bacterium]